jgi:hypothetical protein
MAPPWVGCVERADALAPKLFRDRATSPLYFTGCPFFGCPDGRFKLLSVSPASRKIPDHRLGFHLSRPVLCVNRAEEPLNEKKDATKPQYSARLTLKAVQRIVVFDSSVARTEARRHSLTNGPPA